MTQEQLNSHIVAHDSTPLDALSPEGRRQFLDSLFFSTGGLGSYNYSILTGELDFDQAYRIMQMFGQESSLRTIYPNEWSARNPGQVRPALMPDHAGYSCVGRANCQKNSDFICMSSC